ncbi:MAG: TraM recognition domain-containing protein [Phycisphaerales bacterium]|nr:TraM recognition domain-containing protein [Phycisphaerales bacterium]
MLLSLFKPRAKRVSVTRLGQWDLDRPLLEWTRGEVWSVRDALEGALIVGATGSGKTSGSGAAMSRAMLEAGFGGLVLTAKADERALWQRYCAETGRSSDLLIFGPDHELRFNFLDDERTRGGAGAGLTENIVALFSIVLEVAERRSGGGGGREDDGYWRRALRQLLRNLVDLLIIAGRPISVPELYRLVVTAPVSLEQATSDDWKAESFCFKCLREADARAKSASQERDFELVADYFLLEFPGLSEKTRSVVVSTLTSTIDVLNRGVLRELFSTSTNVTPDQTADGRIILLDLPVKEYAEVGLIAQTIFKYAFQRAIERRDVTASPRPVFLWADEAQHFITSYDQGFQTTCRSARVATVLLTQNTPNVYAALGDGETGKSRADSLFGNLNTKIFHANGDHVTNEWASQLIGRTRQLFASGNSSHPTSLIDWGDAPQSSGGFSEAYEFEVQPSVFTRLRTGGPGNGGNVDAIIVRNGRVFPTTGKTWLRTTFRQG